MYKLNFYVPASHLESVKKALFAVGAGRLNGYDQCCWQILGEGQFRPLAGSRPFWGQMHQLKNAPEYKVEMVCLDSVIENAVKTLLDTHPYEQPAYEIYRLLTLEELAAG
ncbi:MAG: NGG1p interacting factor NIF3 [Gammaproteobacteria bacterium]